eukprot:TRINITY_DN2526_c0_g1_i3.p2 TRINITY_DN2526_c0_g1~~TRINITY_DN2526_c0_g1_i3.p2  ORF type:complete len:103 (-),score=0.60 TRINITY_DN2526_c0_g1_i3:337-645(-)
MTWQGGGLRAYAGRKIFDPASHRTLPPTQDIGEPQARIKNYKGWQLWNRGDLETQLSGPRRLQVLWSVIHSHAALFLAILKRIDSESQMIIYEILDPETECR